MYASFRKATFALPLLALSQQGFVEKIRQNYNWTKIEKETQIDSR